MLFKIYPTNQGLLPKNNITSFNSFCCCFIVQQGFFFLFLLQLQDISSLKNCSLQLLCSIYICSSYIYIKLKWFLISVTKKIYAAESWYLGVTGLIKAFACARYCHDAPHWADTKEIKSGLRKEERSRNGGGLWNRTAGKNHELICLSLLH